MIKRILSFGISFAVLLSIFCIKTDASAADSDAEAFVVINPLTKYVLDGKNIDKRLPMASTTKIMTAIILCENVTDLDMTVVATREMVTVEGSSMGLLEGDTVSYHDLLYGLLLASGNDAANTIALSLCGSIDAFVGKMNAKAKELGLKNTHFQTPSGLDGDEHYTSAYDLAVIAAYALSNPLIRKATSTQKAVLNYGNPPYRRSITNHNKLIGSYEGAIGVKTGFTKKSGRCLVSAVERDWATLIVVTLNAANDFENHKILYDENFPRIKEHIFSSPINDLKVLSSETDMEYIVNSDNIMFKLTDDELADLDYKIMLSDFLYSAEIGDTVGSVKYYYCGNETGETDIKITDIIYDKKRDAFSLIKSKMVEMLLF